MSPLEKLGIALIALSLTANVAFGYVVVQYFRWCNDLGVWPARAIWFVLNWFGNRLTDLPSEYVIEKHDDGRVVIWHQKRILSDSHVSPDGRV